MTVTVKVVIQGFTFELSGDSAEVVKRKYESAVSIAAYFKAVGATPAEPPTLRETITRATFDVASLPTPIVDDTE